MQLSGILFPPISSTMSMTSLRNQRNLHMTRYVTVNPDKHEATYPAEGFRHSTFRPTALTVKVSRNPVVRGGTESRLVHRFRSDLSSRGDEKFAEPFVTEDHIATLQGPVEGSGSRRGPPFETRVSEVGSASGHLSNLT